ncbi:hypothetical protein Q1695_013389 [Nippostrongylus brasiliensis]|nr:hypothetical protein Q1695_013389 [Nippostrongylus brasiliensis]
MIHRPLSDDRVHHRWGVVSAPRSAAVIIAQLESTSTATDYFALLSAVWHRFWSANQSIAPSEWSLLTPHLGFPTRGRCRITCLPSDRLDPECKLPDDDIYDGAIGCVCPESIDSHRSVHVRTDVSSEKLFS